MYVVDLSKPNIYYEYGYQPEEARAAGKPWIRRNVFFPDRKSLIRGTGYYMNCWVVRLPEAISGIRWFKLGIDYLPPGFNEKRYEDVMTLIFVIQGSGIVYNTPVHAGDVFYTPPLVPQQTITNPNDPWVQVWIQVGGGYENLLIEKLKQLSPDAYLFCNQLQSVKNLAEYLIYQQDPAGNMIDYIKAILSMFLSFITSPRFSYNGQSKETKRSRESLVQSACDYIQRHLSTVTVTELADNFHFNRKYFAQIFREVTGSSPQEYIIDRKLSWAKFFLSESDMTLEQIMKSIGYEHRNGLITAFRKKYGCPPATYRKEKKNTLLES